MRRIRPLLPLVALIVFVLAFGRVSARQASQEGLAVSPKSIEAPLLKLLTVFPVPGSTLQPVSLTFAIPAGKTIFKYVGPGKDVHIPVEALGSATFSHNGPEGSVTVNAYLTNDSSVDVTPNADISTDARAPL